MKIAVLILNYAIAVFVGLALIGLLASETVNDPVTVVFVLLLTVSTILNLVYTHGQKGTM